MTRILRSLVPFVAALLVGLAANVAAAQNTSHDEHHPAPATGGAAAGAPNGQAGTTMPSGKGDGMMGGDHMSKMMKMMEEMHGKMMGGDGMMQPKGDSGPASMAFNGVMSRMHRDMAITYTGNADVDFVKGMIPHHQAAVDMAKTALAFGKDPEVKKVAEGIIKAQETEIAWMKEWLKKQGQ